MLEMFPLAAAAFTDSVALVRCRSTVASANLHGRAVTAAGRGTAKLGM